MNQALKQRLVGAVVLVALAVIFLPAVFNGGRHAQMEAPKDVVPAPQVATLVVEAPSRVESAADGPLPAVSDMYSMEAKPLSAIEKIQQVANTVTTTGKPVLDSKKHPNAWVLQVGVFSDKSKAEALKKKLHDKGYRAFTRYGKTATRVMIGPELEQSVVMKLKDSVDKEFAVKSIVVKFEP